MASAARRGRDAQPGRAGARGGDPPSSARPRDVGWRRRRGGTRLGHVSITRTVDAPVADVHAFVVDAFAYPRWMTMIEKVMEVDGRLRTVGAEFAAKVQLAGRPLETRWRVVEVDPPTTTRFRITSENEGHADLTIVLGDLDGRTEVHLEATYRLPGGSLAELADRLFVERSIARDADRALTILGALAEG